MKKLLFLGLAMAACAVWSEPASETKVSDAAAPKAGVSAPVRVSQPALHRLPPSVRDRAPVAMTSRPQARSFGRLSDGRETHIWRLQGLGGLTLDVTDYGGRVVRCLAPDRYGNLADVTLGWNTAEEYEKYGSSMGTIVGRFGNRIRDGRFTLDGQEYVLDVNETNPPPRHCTLHGGAAGWERQVWNARVLSRGPVKGIELSYVSKDGEMGFPGTVTCRVTYRVMPNNVWMIDYEATTDKPTVINPSQHGYWNMAGEASGDILGQEIQIFADEYLPTDGGLIPLGRAPVKDTGFDFTVPKPFGSMMSWMAANTNLVCTGNWYDHNFCLRGKIGELHPAIMMRDPVSGRRLEIWTVEPGLQIYGSQDFDASRPAKTAGTRMCRYGGLVIETQHFPDSPNQPDFPSTVLRPGEVFRSHSEYRFTAE